MDFDYIKIAATFIIGGFILNWFINNYRFDTSSNRPDKLEQEGKNLEKELKRLKKEMAKLQKQLKEAEKEAEKEANAEKKQ